MEENTRGQWGSTFGFLMAAVGSAVGLGNIWGFPYKMGKSGGFTFLLVYLLLAAFVGSFAAILLGMLSKRLGIFGFELGFALMGAVTLIAAIAYGAAALFTFEGDRIE